MAGQPTVHDLAKQLGISVATVSRALNDGPNVRKETRERVKKAAKAAGYQPNILARALRREQTKLIGLIVPDVSSEFFAGATAVLQRALEARDFQLMLCVSHDDPEIDRRYLEQLLQQRADGIVHVPCTPDGAAFLEEMASSPPVVEMTRRSTARHADTVTAEDREGAVAVTRHLLDLGHRRIALLGGNPAASTARDRIEGFREAAATAGLGDDAIVLEREFSVAWGVEATNQALAMTPRPTAIFATNTQLAAGMLQAAAAADIDVPAEISLVGFDDPAWYLACRPAVTTYADPLEQIALMSAELLLRRIENPRELTTHTHARLAGELKVRGSSGPPPA
jgi:DNA-binding LacI/PurR family transcriptional regulator